MNILLVVFITIIILWMGWYFYDLISESFQLKCILSTVDGKKYCIRDRELKQEAVDLLASVVQDCVKLVEYVAKKFPEDEAVKRLINGFNPERISETLPSSTYTAYSENKGEKLAFCLNKYKENPNKLIEMDTLMFVAIHELSHIMTLTIGHDSTFWANFKFLLENAKEAGIHNPVDYQKNPEPYCGMSISDNPYYNL